MAQHHGEEEVIQDGRKLTQKCRGQNRGDLLEFKLMDCSQLCVSLAFRPGFCWSCLGVFLQSSAWRRVRLFSRCSGGRRQPVRNRNQVLTDLLTRCCMGSSSAVLVYIFYIYVFHVYILFIFSLLLLRFVSYLM